ncbi:MAG: hypothetical protein CML29_13860 [Rhizobiales bacterium]|nr:hypothetical protein [Hyphomicrobiales bacterium]MBA68989.1 hypothetical protein [Hyphomicrobiales bacterium]|tara:strand:+ start:368 stop:760 length:393 start_codon:yes stop_codon:yes gene_type:complete
MNKARRCAALTTVLVSAAVLAGCNDKSSAPSSGSLHAQAVSTLQKVNTQAHQCWLKDDAFKAYGIVPELDTSGTPRLLVIPRGKPQALPQLVIAAMGPSVSLYGPLTDSSLSPRIKADVGRWSKGASGCA